MDDERDRALLEAVQKIPPTWTCLRCNREFSNSPGGPQPFAFETELGDDGRQRIKGDICEDCYK